MAGDLVAVVIPDGDLMVSARFRAGPGLGRIGSRQHARMRLDALPWMRFGQIEAEVVRVGQETVDGLLSVECRLLSDHHHGVDLQHGMQGTLAVEVDRMSPLELVLTVAGKNRGRPIGERAPATSGGGRG